jgi:hypothetical protein
MYCSASGALLECKQSESFHEGRQMPDTDGWLTEDEVLAKTGVGHFSFVRFRALGFVPKGNRRFLGRGVGSTVFVYPPIAVPMIQRVVELRKAHAGYDGVFWGLWLDGYPVEVTRWPDARLKRLQAKTTGVTDAAIKAVARQLARQPAKRTSPHRAIFRHLQEQEGRRSLLSWAGAIGVGIEPALGLYTTGSVLTTAFEKGIGAAGVPDPALEVEEMSVPRLREILAKAGLDELEQARRDCKTISDLVALAETIDWRRVRAPLDVPRQGVSEGRGGPIEPFEGLISLWRSFDTRAFLIPYLVFVRSLPGYRYELDETLASKAIELRALADVSVIAPDDSAAALEPSQ